MWFLCHLDGGRDLEKNRYNTSLSEDKFSAADCHPPAPFEAGRFAVAIGQV
jgi:hypothetical protein